MPPGSETSSSSTPPSSVSSSLSRASTGLGVADYLFGRMSPLYSSVTPYSPVRWASGVAGIATGSQGSAVDKTKALATGFCLLGQFTRLATRAVPVVGQTVLAHDVMMQASNLIDARANNGCTVSIALREQLQRTEEMAGKIATRSMTQLAIGAKASVHAPFHERLVNLD